MVSAAAPVDHYGPDDTLDGIRRSWAIPGYGPATMIRVNYKRRGDVVTARLVR